MKASSIWPDLTDYDAYKVTATNNGSVAESITMFKSGFIEDAEVKEPELVRQAMLQSVQQTALESFGAGVDFEITWSKAQKSGLNLFALS